MISVIIQLTVNFLCSIIKGIISIVNRYCRLSLMPMACLSVDSAWFQHVESHVLVHMCCSCTQQSC